jgi:spore coat protein A, manganese oxidase
MAYSLDPLLDTKWQHWSLFKTPKLATRRSIAADGTWEFRVHLKAIQHDFHPLIQGVKLWTYGNGKATDTWPGVTIQGQYNVPVRVRFVNDLVGENLDSLIALGARQGMEETHMIDTISHNQVHLHGARVPWTSDGSPMNVFHPHESRGYYYPNEQAAATMWYHDHAMDVTRLNVYAGLAGCYFLRDPAEVGRLPEGEFEVTIVLQDRSFLKDPVTLENLPKLRYEQSIDYSSPDAVAANAPIPTPEFLGEYPVVNGKIWPTMKAKCAVYRWRLVNGANTRYFKLSLTTKADPNAKIDFHIIGTDGGLLPAPLPLRELVLAPGERADILVDLTDLVGADLILRNSADIPYPGDGPLPAIDNCAELMRILVSGAVVAGQDKFKPSYIPAGTLALPLRVDPKAGGDLADLPVFADIDAVIQATLLATEGAAGSILPVVHPNLAVAGSAKTFTFRRLVLEEYEIPMLTLEGKSAPVGNPINWGDLTDLPIPTVLINGETGAKNVPGVATAEPVVTHKDAYEVWEFVNFTPDSHPMHIHLVQFRVLSRRNMVVIDDDSRKMIDVTNPPNLIPINPLLPNPKRADGYDSDGIVLPYEATGWKDTVQCEPDQATRVLMRFDGFSGEYVYHCHILEHEDMGMMYALNVEPKL